MWTAVYRHSDLGGCLHPN